MCGLLVSRVQLCRFHFRDGFGEFDVLRAPLPLLVCWCPGTHWSWAASECVVYDGASGSFIRSRHEYIYISNNLLGPIGSHGVLQRKQGSSGSRKKRCRFQLVDVQNNCTTCDEINGRVLKITHSRSTFHFLYKCWCCCSPGCRSRSFSFGTSHGWGAHSLYRDLSLMHDKSILCARFVAQGYSLYVVRFNYCNLLSFSITRKTKALTF